MAPTTIVIIAACGFGAAEALIRIRDHARINKHNVAHVMTAAACGLIVKTSFAIAAANFAIRHFGN
jgi:hypothetical protein